jgi:hypothetical protein
MIIKKSAMEWVLHASPCRANSAAGGMILKARSSEWKKGPVVMVLKRHEIHRKEPVKVKVETVLLYCQNIYS